MVPNLVFYIGIFLFVPVSFVANKHIHNDYVYDGYCSIEIDFFFVFASSKFIYEPI